MHGEKLDEEQAGRLGARICAAASEAAQADAALIELVAEFDTGGAVRWWHGLKSVAHWLSWACSMAPGTAREHVRVARALRRMPTVAAAFAEGRLSYSKVREATRVVDLVDEAQLCDFALTATAAQLARTISGYRRSSGARIRQERERALTWTEREDEMVDFRIRLPKDEAAVLVAALNAAKDQFGEPPPKPMPGRAESDATPGYGYADAVLDLARTFLGTAPGDRSGEDRTLVVVKVAAEHLVSGAAENVPAGTSEAPDGTCPVAGFGGVEVETARKLACDADLIGAVVGADGEVLALGRTRRLVSRAQRRALMIRDGMCQFPGCHQARHLKAHHRVSWADGGPTDLDNLILLCQFHHTTVHEGRISVTPAAQAGPGRRWDFTLPDGRDAGGWPADMLSLWLARRVGPSRVPADTDNPANLLRHPADHRLFPRGGGEGFDLHECVLALFGMQRPRREKEEVAAAA